MSKNKLFLLVLFVCSLDEIVTYPVSQPVYQTLSAIPQQVQPQQIPVEYFKHLLSQQSPGSSTPVKDLEQNESPAPQQNYARQPTQQVLQSNVDRQVQLVQQQIYQPQALRYQQNQPQYQLIQLSQPTYTQPQQTAPRYVAPPGNLQKQKNLQQQISLRQNSQGQEEELPKDYDPNPSYQFGFDVRDDLYTNYQNRKEQREGDKITGSYSVVDSDGFIRTVTYTADPKEGFKAEVNRQPTDIVVKIPTPTPPTNLLRHHQTQQYLQASIPVGRTSPQ